MFNKQKLFSWIFALALLVLSACQPATTATTDTLIVLLDNDEGPITPVNFNTAIGFWVTGWVYDGLYILSPELEPLPDLATEAKVSEDGLTWDITLRDDVKWHDGEPFTAEDVIFSYDFLIRAGRAAPLNVINSMEANGDFALTIELSGPSPFFLRQGLATAYIMPEHIWKDQQPLSDSLNQFQGKIGTGAYQLVEISPGEAYTFEANEEYFRGKPQVNTIIAKIVKDRTQQINQLKTNNAQAVLSSVPPAFVSDLKNSGEIELALGSDFFNYNFYMNGSRPPFDEVNVRKAISQSIDTRTLVDTVMLGNGTTLPKNFYHPDLPWSIGIDHVYDPTIANTLLDEAGVLDTDGDGIREYEGNAMSYEVLCDINNQIEVRSSEIIIEQLSEIGINAKQRCMDIDTLVTFVWPNFVSVSNPEYEMSLFAWSSGTQFQKGFLQFLTNGEFGATGWANISGMSDEELDNLFDEFLNEPDSEKQDLLFEQIQERFAEIEMFIPLMSPGGNFAYRSDSYNDWVYTRGTGIHPIWSFLSKEARP